MTTYYVSTTGSDGAAGGSGSPWATMSKAMATAVAGDTVRFRDGTYSSAGNLIQTAHGTSGSPITFMADTYHGATLSCTDVAQVRAFLSFQGNYVHVTDFTITAPGNYVGLFMRGLFPETWRIDVYHVADFEVSNVGGAGIDFAHITGYDQEIDAICDSCRVVNIGGGYASTYTYRAAIQGVYLSSPHGSIRNCLSAEVSGFPIHAYHGGSYWSVENNTVMRGGTGGILIGTDTTHTQQGSTVRNNIVKDCSTYGIREYQDVSFTVGTIIYEYNNVIGSTTASYFLYPNTVTLGGIQNVHTNDVIGDPQFVNYQTDGSGDYRLKNTSPCIDTGTPTLAPSYDYLGVLRPQGSGYDLGAYEYVPAQSNAKGGLSLRGA